jgi:hypothetical protein
MACRLHPSHEETRLWPTSSRFDGDWRGFARGVSTPSSVYLFTNAHQAARQPSGIRFTTVIDTPILKEEEVKYGKAKIPEEELDKFWAKYP